MKRNDTKNIRLMGIDPGLRVTGYGVIQSNGPQITVITYGAIRTHSEDSVASRLKCLYTELSEIMTRYQPQQVTIEQVFMAYNVSSALKLGQARGVALVSAYAAGAEISEYSALEVKKAVVGVGRATKEQVQIMVQHLLGLKEIPEPNDAADALALAICHLHCMQSLWPQEAMSRKGWR